MAHKALLSCGGHPRILASVGCPSCRKGRGLHKVHFGRGIRQGRSLCLSLVQVYDFMIFMRTLARLTGDKS